MNISEWLGRSEEIVRDLFASIIRLERVESLGLGTLGGGLGMDADAVWTVVLGRYY